MCHMLAVGGFEFLGFKHYTGVNRTEEAIQWAWARYGFLCPNRVGTNGQ